MKKVNERGVTSILILVIIASTFMGTLLTGYASVGSSLYKSVTNKNLVGDFVTRMISGLEKGWNDGVFLRSQIIDIYGGIQRCLGKRIVNDADPNKTVMLGSDGNLYFYGNVTGIDNEEAMNSNIKKLSEFKRFCKDRGVNFLFVIAPDKYNSDQVSLPLSVKDYMEITREFTTCLVQEEVCCLNLQELLKKESRSYTNAFFRTDHHWRIHTAFWGLQKITEKMWPRDTALLSIDNFTSEIASTEFLGSMGIRAGKLYAEADTVFLIAPTFETDLTVEYQTKTLKSKVVRKGPFRKSVIDMSNPGYNMYITSDNALIHVVNYKQHNGRRVMFIKDSFGVPVAAWMSLLSKELWVVDVRYAQEKSVCQMVEDYGISDIIMMYNPGMLGSEMFRFREVSNGK